MIFLSHYSTPTIFIIFLMKSIPWNFGNEDSDNFEEIGLGGSENFKRLRYASPAFFNNFDYFHVPKRRQFHYKFLLVSL